MKLKINWRTVFAGKPDWSRQLLLAALVTTGIFSATAQPVVAPPPSVSVMPPAMQAMGPGEMQVFSPGNPLTAFLDEVQPLQWGPVTVRPHVFYSFTYGTGILSSTNQQHDTAIQSLAPGLLLVLGQRWTLDYTPTLTLYSDKNFKNTVGQSVTLTGGANYNDWVFGLSQNFNYSSAPQVLTGTQTAQQTFGTAFSASHPLNSKMSVDLGLDQNLSFPSGFQSSLQWSTMDWLNYEFWPRLNAGVGAGLGYTVSTPDSVFEQLQARVNWRATDKLGFGINAGGEFSQFTEGGSRALLNPIFGANIRYQPFEQTQISLNASRTVNSSLYKDQVNETTSVTANLSQRLLEKFYLNLGGSYNWNDYAGTSASLTGNNSENYYSLNASLGTTIFRRVSVSVFYSYSDNAGSLVGPQAGQGFVSHQFGFNVGYQY